MRAAKNPGKKEPDAQNLLHFFVIFANITMFVVHLFIAHYNYFNLLPTYLTLNKIVTQNPMFKLDGFYVKLCAGMSMRFLIHKWICSQHIITNQKSGWIYQDTQIIPIMPD